MIKIRQANNAICSTITHLELCHILSGDLHLLQVGIRELAYLLDELRLEVLDMLGQVLPQFRVLGDGIDKIWSKYFRT